MEAARQEELKGIIAKQDGIQPSAAESGAHGAFADASTYAKHSSMQREAALRAWRMLPSGFSCARWLDIGCGPATLTNELFTQTPRVASSALGIDLSRNHVDYANQHYPELQVLCGSATDTNLFQSLLHESRENYGGNAFDLATCFATLHWLTPDEQSCALRNFASVLRPHDGRLLLAHFSGVENKTNEAAKSVALASPELMKYLQNAIKDSRPVELHRYYFDSTSNDSVKQEWSARLTDCGFAIQELEVYEHRQEFTADGLVGFMRPLSKYLPLLPDELRQTYEEHYLKAMKELGAYDEAKGLYILRSRMMLVSCLRESNIQ